MEALESSIYDLFKRVAVSEEAHITPTSIAWLEITYKGTANFKEQRNEVQL